MTDREKALLTIIMQIDTEKNLPLGLKNGLEQELLENYSNHFQEMHYNELVNNGINSNRAFILCADGKIYYISADDALNRCKFCPEYETCPKGQVY